MQLEHLHIGNFRKIATAEIHPSPGLNFFFGKNGSGKTSLLEAIYLLHAGKSFRAKNPSELISLNEDTLAVSGVVSNNNSERTEIRVIKRKESSRYTVNDRNISSASQLATALPMLLINSDSFDVINGSSRIRRSIIDRTLFHVEPTYLEFLIKFNKATKQRTHLLRVRASLSELAYWDNEFTSNGLRVHHARLDCVQHLNQKLNERNLHLSYVPGWKQDLGLEEAIVQDRDKDFATGRISSGPHKAEVLIEIDQKPASKFASRGQIKTAVFLIMDAVSAYIVERRGWTPIFLIDDVSAELDADSQSLVLNFIANTRAQAFITALTDRDFKLPKESFPSKIFHVEHGIVQTCQP
ncbi:MAG: DNA replication and repair protein RecF [Gammaproteobacteria bacterium]|nr:DNA replication and repair protein RecF [Gammaproteobacteria bacterium]